MQAKLRRAKQTSAFHKPHAGTFTYAKEAEDGFPGS